MIYFNMALFCDRRNDTLSVSDNIYVDLTKFLSAQQTAIASSMKELRPIQGDYLVLPFAIISDEVYIKKYPVGFRNDTPPSHLSAEEKKRLELMIQARKAGQ